MQARQAERCRARPGCTGGEPRQPATLGAGSRGRLAEELGVGAGPAVPALWPTAGALALQSRFPLTVKVTMTTLPSRGTRGLMCVTSPPA